MSTTVKDASNDDSSDSSDAVLNDRNLKWITQRCIYFPLAKHDSKKNVMHRLCRCLHSSKPIDSGLPHKIMKHMPAFNGRLPYGVVLQVSTFIYLRLVKKHDKLVKSDGKKCYRKLWSESFDAISMLKQFHTDLCVVGPGAEEAYYDHVRKILLSKLANSAESYVELYQKNPYFYQTAREHVKLIDLKKKKFDRANKKQNQPNQNKSKEKKQICRYFQANSCTRNPCQWEHKCFFCGDKSHGICDCDSFLNKAGLVHKSSKKSK